MVEIEINDIKYQIPQSWDECNKKQLIGLYNIIMSDSETDLLETEIVPAKRIRMLQYLLNLDDKFMVGWKSLRRKEHGEDGGLVFYSELDELCKQLDGFFDIQKGEEQTLYSINLGLTRCPFSSLARKTKKQKRKNYYAPADELSNLSLYELGMSFTQFESYLASNDITEAHRLIAMLYRPGKPAIKKNIQSGYQGDRRLPLLNHEATIEKRQAHIAALPDIVKQLILFWFASCRAKIVEAHPDIFTSSDEGDSGPNFGWGGVLLSLSGGLVHLNEVSQQPYQNGLLYLRYLEAQRKEQEKRLRKKS